MAFRAVSTASRPPLLPTTPPSSSSSSSTPKLSSLSKSTPLKTKFEPISVSLPTTVTSSISLFTLITSSNEAKAFTLSKDQIMTSLTQVEDTIDQAQEVGSGVLNLTQSVFKVVIDTLKPGIDVAMPLLQKAGEQALEIASPAISEASKKTQEVLQDSGIDTAPVLSAAKTVTEAAQQSSKVLDVAKPIASSTFETISSAGPIVIVEAAGAIFLAYILLPPIWSAISFNLRGYKGKLSPAQTLDLLSTQNYILIDIRSEKDKDKAGLPRLPPNAKNKMISIPLEELPIKIKNIVRNTKQVEAEIAAVKISYLKRVGKGLNIVIMDSYSDIAKIVAKTLTSLGIKNCWIMADGFSGGQGWIQSRLGVDSYNVSSAEVLSPSRVIPAVRKIGTKSSTSFQSSRKFLPGSTE
ncbi:Calcium sensing receptor protein [Thalictrum thalictroides]|uniref:Calcium sensing receptor protein n=1 Tax=Thalictrum thalictroides TaxID=46969 RepID=A0A7J6VIW5_THATH|nr:Calcium sensing receptor protein [Thalictrum thalictroides]